MTHRPGVNIIPIHGKTPVIHDTAFIAPGCTIIGDVEIGAGSSIWYNCVLRADVFSIRIGERTNVQDGSVLHCDPPRPGDPDGCPLVIGDDVLIGHMAMLHGCTLEDRAFVGLGAPFGDLLIEQIIHGLPLAEKSAPGAPGPQIALQRALAALAAGSGHRLLLTGRSVP